MYLISVRMSWAAISQGSSYRESLKQLMTGEGAPHTCGSLLVQDIL